MGCHAIKHHHSIACQHVVQAEGYGAADQRDLSLSAATDASIAVDLRQCRDATGRANRGMFSCSDADGFRTDDSCRGLTSS